MEILAVVSVITLVVVIAVGVVLRRFTKRTLSDMDGLGEVSSQEDAGGVKF